MRSPVSIRATGEYNAITNLGGNYPLTVGTQNPHTRTEAVTIRHGHFRIEGSYDPPVRVPDVMLKCVGFVGEAVGRDENGNAYGDLLATGFFVSVPGERVLSHFVYFVTAKHVARDLRGKEAYFLVNKLGGGVTTIPAMSDHWYLHPADPTADIAVVPVGDDGTTDIRAVKFNTLATPKLLQEFDIGVGDEVFATGLFTPVAGVARNEPIVRHGNIAMMPCEQIQTELGYADIYLVEARSIGGISGSPVFVRPSLRMMQDVLPRTQGSQAPAYSCILLGLMHGHWDIKESEMNRAYITHDRKHGVNLGIGIVVPAQKIIETIFQPELYAMRKKYEDERTRSSIPGMDSAKRTAQDKEEPFTKQDFEDALKKASRKITPDEK
jgi:hypothetical protein